MPADNARDLPDVSLFAANGFNGSYYAVCAADGDCQSTTSPQISGFGGTSVASPAFAGIMAIVNQAYGPQGQADYELYPLAAKEPSAFHDVTLGTNQMPCQAGSANCTNGELTGYAATPGYDLATGLGSIDANVLVTNWNSRSNGTATHHDLYPLFRLVCPRHVGHPQDERDRQRRHADRRCGGHDGQPAYWSARARLFHSGQRGGVGQCDHLAGRQL